MGRRLTLAEYREYKDGDEGELISLFNEVFKSDRDEEYWRWQYKDFPSGKPIICLAEEENKIIGQTTLFPNVINFKGEELLGGYSIDSMVKNEHRRQGIYLNLANQSYEKGFKKGIRFRYGFPILGALLGLTDRLGATIVDDIPIFIRVYRLDNFLTSKLKNKTLAKVISLPSMIFTKFLYKELKVRPKANYEIRRIEDFNDDFNNLWERVKDSLPLMTPRTKNFLNWRIKDHPTYDYTTFASYLDGELVGYMVVKIQNNKVKDGYSLRVGYIVDMLGINDNVISCIYLQAKEYFKQNNVDFALSWAGDSNIYRQMLINLGFYKSRTSITFVVKELSGDKELEDIITKEKNWNIMPIESDIY